MPPERPAEIAPAAPDAGDESGDAAEVAPPETPEPVPNPAEDERTEDGEADEPENATSPEPPVPSVPERLSPEARAACLATLDRLGVVYETINPIAGEGGCGVGDPVRVSSVSPGITLTPEATVGCRTAAALARWVEGLVAPSARVMGEGVRLSGLSNASGYVCRRRNNAADGKLSEHATGGAIDISGFSFKGRPPIPVEPRAGRGTMAEAFQRTVRAGACLYFSTVLGPGSDDYHDDHLHFDLARRNSGYRLCQ